MFQNTKIDEFTSFYLSLRKTFLMKNFKYNFLDLNNFIKNHIQKLWGRRMAYQEYYEFHTPGVKKNIFTNIKQKFIKTVIGYFFGYE